MLKTPPRQQEQGNKVQNYFSLSQLQSFFSYAPAQPQQKPKIQKVQKIPKSPSLEFEFEDKNDSVKELNKGLFSLDTQETEEPKQRVNTDACSSDQ